MKSEFFLSFVKHVRFFPKKYAFDYRFFWTKFNLDELDELHHKTPLFSRNEFNLVSYYDNDHINLGYHTTKDNIQAFMLEQGVTEGIRQIDLLTNPRILGYTFNPVSFFFIETFANSYIVIEIGNTFNERKPYLVKPECLIEDEWVFTTPKHFYISPFTSVENSLTFKIKKKAEGITINIQDYNKNGKLEVTASYSGSPVPWSTKSLLRLLFLYPLITFRIIFAIHYHAMKLYLKRIPYWKKTDDEHLQHGHYIWKDYSFRKK